MSAGSKRYGRWLLGLLMLFVVLACAGCRPSLAGDYGQFLEGVASSSGWVGIEVDGQLFSVDVETGDTAEQIGLRLTALMKAAGLVVDCERYDGERYTFILRDVDGPPEGKREAAFGITMAAGGGPIRDHPGGIKLEARSFFDVLNANNLTGMRRMATPEFYEQVSDLMASMAASGEQVFIESMEEPTIGCYEATIGLHLVWEAGAGQQHVDGYLTLSRHSFTGWLVSGGVIR
ncbi:hypothetical protein ES703_07637 [subsurface metagenome]